MADNTPTNKPTVPGGQNISTEDMGGGVWLPRGKIVIGDHGVDGGDVSAANPLPAYLGDGQGHRTPPGDDPTRPIFVALTDGTTEIGTASHPLRVDPVTLGQKAMASSSPVVVANDQTPIPVEVEGTVTVAGVVALSGTPTVDVGNFPSGKASTGTPSSVAAAVADTELLAPNPNRVRAMVWNESNATLYLALGFAASPTQYTAQVAPGDFAVIDEAFTGIVNGYWSAANGFARVTELTP